MNLETFLTVIKAIFVARPFETDDLRKIYIFSKCATKAADLGNHAQARRYYRKVDLLLENFEDENAPDYLNSILGALSGEIAKRVKAAA